jgi:hypothetical protein
LGAYARLWQIDRRAPIADEQGNHGGWSGPNSDVLKHPYFSFPWALGGAENMVAHARMASAWFSDAGVALQAKMMTTDPASVPVASALYNEIPL